MHILQSRCLFVYPYWIADEKYISYCACKATCWYHSGHLQYAYIQMYMAYTGCLDIADTTISNSPLKTKDGADVLKSESVFKFKNCTIKTLNVLNDYTDLIGLYFYSCKLFDEAGNSAVAIPELPGLLHFGITDTEGMQKLKIGTSADTKSIYVTSNPDLTTIELPNSAKLKYLDLSGNKNLNAIANPEILSKMSEL